MASKWVELECPELNFPHGSFFDAGSRYFGFCFRNFQGPMSKIVQKWQLAFNDYAKYMMLHEYYKTLATIRFLCGRIPQTNSSF